MNPETFAVLDVFARGMEAAWNDPIARMATLFLATWSVLALVFQGLIPLIVVKRALNNIKRIITPPNDEQLYGRLTDALRDGVAPTGYLVLPGSALVVLLIQHVRRQKKKLAIRPSASDPRTKSVVLVDPPDQAIPAAALPGSGLPHIADRIVQVGLFFTFFSIALALLETVQGISQVSDPAKLTGSITTLLDLSAKKFAISAAALFSAIVIRIAAGRIMAEARRGYAALNNRFESVFGYSDDNFGSAENAAMVGQIESLTAQVKRSIDVNDKNADSLCQAVMDTFAKAIREINVRLDPQIAATLQRAYLHEVRELGSTLARLVAASVAAEMRQSMPSGDVEKMRAEIERLTARLEQLIVLLESFQTLVRGAPDGGDGDSGTRPDETAETPRRKTSRSVNGVRGGH